tara:strand:- start:981 stop:1688 length:708 start_codon:yes stop_codon:yes gene_type:complete
MEWLNIIESRHTTFAWDEDRIPDRSIIDEVLNEVYQHVPSKNLQFPYQVRLLRNDDVNIRKEIMTICHRNQDLEAEVDGGNPQVLAPWLLGFNARYCADTEKRYEKNSYRGTFDGHGLGNQRTNDPHGDQTQSENLEIGIFVAYIMLALANRGIQSGMCQNICNNYQRATEIFKLAEDNRALDFRFIMGIGYGKDTGVRHDYFDPRVGKTKPIPFAPDDVLDHYPRPLYTDIIKG